MFFIKERKIIITTDNIPIYSKKQKFILHVKIGTLFPIVKKDKQFYYSYMYTRFGNKIKLTIPKKFASATPLDFNIQNVKKISSQLLGEKYGWGGFLNNRDCSAMTKDFFASFGLWLPRNSASQKNAGKYLSLKDLSNEEKENMIKKKGIAFLSLIYLHGHIMLYAGIHDNKVMVMHDAWGIRTTDTGIQGRKILGKVVISDLYVGENIHNVTKNSLLIARVQGLMIQPNVSDFYINPFVKAYKDIVNIKNDELVFKDKTTLKFDNFSNTNFQSKLENPTLKDTLSQKYPAFSKIEPPVYNFDPGRFRNDTLLKKLYGKNKKQIKNNLEKLTWVDGTSLLFNKRQNAANQLQKVIDELKTLPKKYAKFLTHIAGSYKFRYIKGTKRLSPHSYGIAIDLNVKHSRYWGWDKRYKYANEIPKEIVDIFEKYGFIWGGRWYHYDTMHFEYRPEFFNSLD